MTELSARNSQLGTASAEAEASYRADIDNLRRLNSMLERRDEAGTARLAEVERDWQAAQSEFASKAGRLEADLARERQRGDELEARTDELRQRLEAANAGLGGESASSRAGTPGLLGPNGASGGGRLSSFFGLSPIAALAAKSQKTGRSYTEIYAEHVKLQDELAAERAEVVRVNECLASVLADIEERAPILREQRAEYERVGRENDALAAQLARTLEERDVNERRAEGFRLDAEGAQTENGLLVSQVSDLGRQVRTLARQLAVRDDPSIGARSDGMDIDEDPTVESADLGTADDIISAELVTFRTIGELQAKNQALLKVARELGQRMDARNADWTADRDRTENEAVQQAHDTIVRLRDELDRLRAQTGAAEREREMLRRLVASRGSTAPTQSPSHGSTVQDEHTRQQTAADEAQAAALERDRNALVRDLQDEAASAHRQLRQDALALAKVQANAEMLQGAWARRRWIGLTADRTPQDGRGVDGPAGRGAQAAEPADRAARGRVGQARQSDRRSDHAQRRAPERARSSPA